MTKTHSNKRAWRKAKTTAEAHGWDVGQGSDFTAYTLYVDGKVVATCRDGDEFGMYQVFHAAISPHLPKPVTGGDS